MAATMETHDTEVPARARRRRFKAEYKQRILREVEQCRQPGEIGALLRREGLYSSHLAAWRAARDAGLAPKRRGTKPRVRDAEAARVAELEHEVTRWQRRAERAEFLVDLQKKVAAILGIELDENGARR